MTAVMAAPAAAPAPEAPPSAAPPPTTAAPPGTAPPPGALAPPGAPPGEGGAPPLAPFADLLNAHVARTATAEGQPKTATDNGGPAKTDNSQDATAEALAAAVAAIAIPVAPVRTLTAKQAAPTQAAPAQAPPAPAAAAQEAQVPVLEAPVDAVTPQAPALPAAVTQAQTPAPAPAAQPTATPQTATPQTTTPQAATPQAATPQPTTPTAAPAQPQNRVSTLLSALSGSVHVTRTLAAAPAKTATPTIDPTSTATTAPAPTATTDAADTGTAPQGDSSRDDAQQPATPTLPTAEANTATTRFEMPKASAPVTLPRAPQALQETIALATRQGATLARIQLSPESLGPINIHLQHTADGVVARVVAGPEAAAHFQQGADELRRSLQDGGVNLIGLQIETSSGRDAQAQAQAHAQTARQNASANADANAGPQDTTDSAPSITRLEPLHGASISVLA